MHKLREMKGGKSQGVQKKSQVHLASKEEMEEMEDTLESQVTSPPVFAFFCRLLLVKVSLGDCFYADMFRFAR